MARATLAAAALLLLLAAAAAQDKCPPGCGTCAPMTADEIAAAKAKKEAKRATWKAKLASMIGKDANGDGKIDAADAPSRPERQDKPDKVWQKCLTCTDAKATTLKDGRCVCNPGFGFALPKPDANGRPVKPTTAPTCAACADNTVSGPDAPKPDWAALGFKKPDWAAAAAKPSASGGRHLLGMGHGRGSFCVPCPANTAASADATKCVPK